MPGRSTSGETKRRCRVRPAARAYGAKGLTTLRRASLRRPLSRNYVRPAPPAGVTGSAASGLPEDLGHTQAPAQGARQPPEIPPEPIGGVLDAVTDQNGGQQVRGPARHVTQLRSDEPRALPL